MGFSQGLSTLVGQALGQGRPDEASRSTRGAAHLLLAYVLVVAGIFLFAPGRMLALFIPAGQGMEPYGPIIATGTVLLRIVAAYVVMDAMYMIFAGVLKGAGDTRFLMWSIGAASMGVMVIPVYVGIEYGGMGVVSAWVCVVAFIATLFSDDRASVPPGQMETTCVSWNRMYLSLVLADKISDEKPYVSIGRNTFVLESFRELERGWKKKAAIWISAARKSHLKKISFSPSWSSPG